MGQTAHAVWERLLRAFSRGRLGMPLNGPMDIILDSVRLRGDDYLGHRKGFQIGGGVGYFLWCWIFACLDNFPSEGVRFGLVHCVDREQLVVTVVPDRLADFVCTGP